jgi:hypothetical protein
MADDELHVVEEADGRWAVRRGDRTLSVHDLHVSAEAERQRLAAEDDADGAEVIEDTGAQPDNVAG